MSARFAPFTLPLFPRAKALGRGWAHEDFRSTSCPDRHLWTSSQGTLQGPRADGSILRVVSPFLRSLSRSRRCGHTSARRASGPSRTGPRAPPVSRLECFLRSTHLAPSPTPSPRDLSRASSSHGWSLHHAPSAPVPRIPSPALVSRAPPTPRAESSEGIASEAPQTEFLVDSGFGCSVTAPSLLVPCAAGGAC